MSGYKRVNFYELCRLCATNQQRHVTTHIFKEEGKRMQLQDKIHNCLSLKVEEDDFLPKVVCSKCLAVLEQSNTFQKECVKSELMLSTYYNNFRYTPDFTESGKVYIKDISAPMLPNPSGVQQALQNDAQPQNRRPNGEPPRLIPKPSNISVVNTQGEVVTIVECAKPATPKIVKIKKISSNTHSMKQNTVLVDNSNVPYVSPPKKQRVKNDSKQHIIAGPLQTNTNTHTLDNLDLDSIQKQTLANHGNSIYHQLKPIAINAQTTTINQNQQQQLSTMQQSYNTYVDSHFTYGNPGTSTTQNNSSNNTSNWLNANQNQENQQHNVIMTSSTAMAVNNNNNNANNQVISNIGINNLNVHQHTQKVLPKVEPLEQKHLSTINMDSISTGSGGDNINVVVGTANMALTGNGSSNAPPKEKPVKNHCCDVCSKIFKRREHLYQHMKLHSGFRPFACAVCGKTFMRKEHLLRHQTSHSGQKNYTCSICDKSFSRNDNLLKHKKTHDKQQVQYECDICPKVFVLKHYFITHKLTHEMQANQRQQNAANRSNMATGNASNCWQQQQNTTESLKA